LLVPLVQSIKFIQDIFKEKEAKLHTYREIANCLAYEIHSKDSNVFEYGKHQTNLMRQGASETSSTSSWLVPSASMCPRQSRLRAMLNHGAKRCKSSSE
jgi:hypothetical protein